MRTYLCDSCHHEWQGLDYRKGTVDRTCGWCGGIGQLAPRREAIPANEWSVDTTDRLTLVRFYIDPPGEHMRTYTRFVMIPCGPDGRTRISPAELDRMAKRTSKPYTRYMVY